jgi:acetyltransferase-like isoleucine patch superfamily enzyme
MSALSIIYPQVVLQGNWDLGLFCIVGEPFNKDEPPATIIGDNAVIRSHTVIYAGNIIGYGFVTGHGVMIRERNHIGQDVSVGTHSVIERDTWIGNRVRIHSNVFIPEYTYLESDVWIGPNATFTNSKYPHTSFSKEQIIAPYVERGAIIGANATILPGVRIGRCAVIGAGAVVTKDVQPFAVIVGNPGIQNRDVREIPEYSDDTTRDS